MPFPSCPKPLFQSEAKCELKCEAIDIKMCFFFLMQINSFAQERFFTQVRFESESLGITEMAFCVLGTTGSLNFASSAAQSFFQ